MPHKRVLITGASGFVGCRLAERLALGSEYKVIAMVHKFSGSGVARLGRLPVDLVSVDLLDFEALSRVAEEADIIIHLAYGNRGSKKEKQRVTISGTENVMKAALHACVRKVLYVSTAAVHGINPRGHPVVDESAPYERSKDVYRKSKINAEKVVWRYHRRHGIPVVVFRPPLIYGPYGKDWTVGIVKEIQSGAILVNGGNGAANLVYVDNLLDAFILAMQKDSGDGEAFFIVDDDHLSWKEVYERYAATLNSHPPFLLMSREEICALRKRDEPTTVEKWTVAPISTGVEMVRHALRSPEIRIKIGEIPWLNLLKRILPKQIKDSLKGENVSVLKKPTTKPRSNPFPLPSNDMVELYSSQSRFSNEKIKKVLGYTQRITFEEGMNLTCSWLRYHRLIP
jgi:nucleoside-diphosphate-sugar epimerase